MDINKGRGSSVFGGEVDALIALDLVPDEDDTVAMWIQGRDIAHGTGSAATKIAVTHTDDSVTFVDTAVPVLLDKNRRPRERTRPDMLFEEMSRTGSMTKAQGASLLGIDQSNVGKHLNTLVEEDRATKVADPGKTAIWYPVKGEGVR